MENINRRGVRSGQFKLKFEGNKLEPITLNTTHAETISSPTQIIGPEYCNIIDNVIPDELYPRPLPKHLQEALNLDSPAITRKNLEKHIWDIHWRMHVICRKDPDPRLQQRTDKEDELHFGLDDSETKECQSLADLFHALILFCYGSNRLVPYIMKRVDMSQSC